MGSSLTGDRLTIVIRDGAAPADPMKAIVYCEYGSPDVLKLAEVEKPVPNDNQILIKVRASSLNLIDAVASCGARSYFA